jgi:AcrR family transcriptional regulator
MDGYTGTRRGGGRRKRGRPPKVEGRDTRARILKAALGLFAREGYAGGSIRKIAKEVGVSESAIYAHFSGKEEIFLALLDGAGEEGTELVAGVFGGKGSPEGRLREVGERTVDDFSEADADLFLLFVEFWARAVREGVLKPELAARYGKVRGRLARLVEGELSDRVAASTEDPEHLATAAMALKAGLLMQKLADPRAVPDGLFGRMLEALFRAASEERG